MNSKEKFLEFYVKNYKFLIQITKKYISEHLATDVVNDLYLYFYEKESINDDIINNKKEFHYFVVSMKNYIFSKNSKFKLKEADKNTLDFFELNTQLDNKTNNLNNETYINIYKKLNELYHKKKISWYNYKLFCLFYYSEYEYDINDLEKKEVDSLRRLSLRKLEEKTGISFNSINYSLKKTLKIIKKHYV